ncbi:MAG TPA: hypothetical protein VK154_06165 [Chitinophagales bacterium]|nr:hypothetical protein [Chitinophagales bacterium]
MLFYDLEPEVPGGLGDNTLINVSVHPPIVSFLHIVFDGWQGDELLEIFPAFLMSATLCDEILQQKFVGYEIKDCLVEKSEQFMEFYPDVLIPNFKWLVVIGRNGDDFCLSYENKLRISERVLTLLRRHHLKHCDIIEVKL